MNTILTVFVFKSHPNNFDKEKSYFTHYKKLSFIYFRRSRLSLIGIRKDWKLKKQWSL